MHPWSDRLGTFFICTTFIFSLTQWASLCLFLRFEPLRMLLTRNITGRRKETVWVDYTVPVVRHFSITHNRFSAPALPPGPWYCTSYIQFKPPGLSLFCHPCFRLLTRQGLNKCEGIRWDVSLISASALLKAKEQSRAGCRINARPACVRACHKWLHQ